MNNKRTYRRSWLYIVFGVASLLGLVLSRHLGPFSGWLPVVFGLFVMVTFKNKTLLTLYAVIMFGLALGLWRGGMFVQETRYLSELYKEKITVVGTAMQDSTYNERGQVSFDMTSLQLESPVNRELIGKVGVSGYGENMIYRGDRVRIKATFREGRGSYAAWMNYAELEVVSRSQSVAYEATREFGAGMLSALPEPQASFGLGLLIGQRDTLPERTKDTLAAVGLTHIIAVSGYNLTILVRATRRLLAKRSKFQAFVGAVALICIFLLVTRGSPSIVRASIISILSLGAWYYGRNFKPLVLISLTAAVTALWNPLYVWSDIGWYLSFLAFFGVLVVAPLAQKHVFKNKMKGVVGEVLLESTAAQIMTLPLILFIFNDSSFVAILANMLVVPLIPLAMLASVVAGIAGTFIPSFAGWLAWPAKWLLTYMLDSANLVSRIPNMQFSVAISSTAMITMYVSIVTIVFIWWRKELKSANLTDRNESNIVV